MPRLVMFLRRRIFQFIAGTAVLIFYIQFQLLSYTDRRLFLKRISLSLPRISGVTNGKLDQRCSHYKTSASLQGFTLMTWTGSYIDDLQSFIEFPLFPKHPVSLQFNMKASLRLPLPISTGGWIFGLLNVPETGHYRFALSTNGEATLKISKDSEPENTRVIASLSLSSSQAKPKPEEYSKYPEQHSISLHLYKCKMYYIEMLFHTSSKQSHVELAWETPNSLQYQVIPNEYISPYIGAQDLAHAAENLLIFEDNYKMNSLFAYLSRQKHSVENENLDQWSRLPFMLSNHARNLPRCSGNFKGFLPSKGLVIPKVNSESTKKFIEDYIARLVRASNGKYTFRGIHHAEEKSLGEEGTRYLVNLEFHDNIMETRIRVSEYLFYENENSDLCFVDDFTWKRGAMVTIIAVIPDMESWSHYFMDHLSAMTSKLQDARFSVIIVAPQGFKEFFQIIVSQNTLAWHSQVTLILMSAKEIKDTENIITVCLSRITIPNTIVFFTDVRVQLPLKVLELVRKQTIEGKTAYIPWPENFDRGFENNATIINPLDRTRPDRAPSLALYVSDLKKLTGLKSTNNRRKTKPVWKKEWWKDLVNGQLEVYASKAPKFFYYQKEQS